MPEPQAVTKVSVGTPTVSVGHRGAPHHVRFSWFEPSPPAAPGVEVLTAEVDVDGQRGACVVGKMVTQHMGKR